VEAYQADIVALYRPPSPNERLSSKELEERARVREEVEKARGVVAVVNEGLLTLLHCAVWRVLMCAPLFSALKEGVMRIVRTFGDRLVAFKFPPRIARRLQEYVDYS
jgi:nucleoporin NDC1